MNFKKLTVGLLFVALTAAITGFIKLEDDPIKLIVAQLEKWTTEHPQEKVYLQFDKPYYGVGDDIWFKGYITVGPKHQLSALSGALNVELIDDQDSVRQWIKLPVDNGLTKGDLALSDTLKEGNYRIRAYTNWMRNDGEEYYFEKNIAIGNAATNTVFTTAAYSYTQLPAGQKVDANITYVNLDNTPYAGKEVSYSIRLNNKQVMKGKGVTNDKGNLAVSFVNATPAAVSTGKIITSIKIADKNTVTKTIAFKSNSGMVDVQFFPESGNLVNGIRSRVAFKAVGTNGLGVDIKGTVTDNNGTELANITTRHLGMGYFALVPESGKTYKASITFPDGSQKSIPLPAAVNQGYVISINQPDTSNISVRVTASSTTDTKGAYLVAQSAGEVCYVARNSAGSLSFSALVPKSKFPSGIAQFTLFSATGQPLNERIAFIQRDADMLKLNISAGKTITAPREKVTIKLNARNNSGQPVIGAFSATVIDESKVEIDDNAETTILSHLLLTSDLKGYIEQPNYYFNKVTEKTQTDLDVLMMTQGYRRFAWKPLLANQIPAPTFPAEKSLQVSGVIKTSGGKSVPNAKVMLFTTKGGTFILDTVADVQGRFAFKNLIFKDSIRFVVQARTAKNSKNVEIVLDNMPSRSTIVNKSMPDLQVNSSMALTSYLKYTKKKYDEEARYGLGNHTIQLNAVTVTEKRKTVLDNSANLNGSGNADQVITGDALDKMGCVSIDQCLNGRLIGVIFRGGIPYSTRSMNTPMQVIVDGIYVEADYLQNIPPTTIGSVEVLRTIGNTAIYGSRGGGGILLITTRRGGDYSTNLATLYSPGIMTYTPKGFYSARQFYSPAYGDPKTNTVIADLRTTIHWAPAIFTDNDGNASFEYFNAGNKGTYRVVVEGINNDGNIGRQVYKYQVQ
jgi:hypothetical protein